MTARADSWRQMRFVAPYGRREILWVDVLGLHRYRVLSVPVWIYNVSVGSIVSGISEENDVLSFGEVVEPSIGGTVRVMVEAGVQASHFYLRLMLPELAKSGVGIGPATFFDPLVVAVHVQTRSQIWPEVADYLAAAQVAGRVRDWESGDPDLGPIETGEGDETLLHSNDELVHPRPAPGRDAQFSVHIH